MGKLANMNLQDGSLRDDSMFGPDDAAIARGLVGIESTAGSRSRSREGSQCRSSAEGAAAGDEVEDEDQGRFRFSAGSSSSGGGGGGSGGQPEARDPSVRSVSHFLRLSQATAAFQLEVGARAWPERGRGGSPPLFGVETKIKRSDVGGGRE